MTDIATDRYGSIVGKTIQSVQTIPDWLCRFIGWDAEAAAVLISFTDGTGMVTTADWECSGPGALLILDQP